MGSFNSFSGKTGVVDAYVEYTGKYTSSTTCTVTLKLFAARIDWTGNSTATYTATCTSPSSWTSTYDKSSSEYFSGGSYLHLCTRTFTVTTNSSGIASVNLSFSVTATSSSSYTVSATITELDLSDTKPATRYAIYYTAGEGTSLTVKRTWNEGANTSGEGAITSGTSIVWNDYFDVTVAALTGYTDAKVSLTNFRTESQITNDDGSITYHGTMSSEGSISITSSATLKSYTLSISSGTGSSITVTRTSSKKTGASTGTLGSGATIYHHDVLKITFTASTGYSVSVHTVNGSSFTSGSTHTVSGAVSVVSAASVKSYTLALNPDTGSTIAVNRISSPIKNAATGSLSNGATIYYNDVLQITFSSSAEYKILSQLVNQSAFTSGGLHTVISDVEIVTITDMSGIVHIYSGTAFENYLIYIYDGTNWVQYIPYVYDGSEWVICS